MGAMVFTAQFNAVSSLSARGETRPVITRPRVLALRSARVAKVAAPFVHAM